MAESNEVFMVHERTDRWSPRSLRVEREGEAFDVWISTPYYDEDNHIYVEPEQRANFAQELRDLADWIEGKVKVDFKLGDYFLYGPENVTYKIIGFATNHVQLKNMMTAAPIWYQLATFQADINAGLFIKNGELK